MKTPFKKTLEELRIAFQLEAFAMSRGDGCDLRLLNAKAGMDFEHAVAVSADGKKVVLADEVIVATENSAQFVRFQPEAFRRNKILRHDDLCRFIQLSPTERPVADERLLYHDWITGLIVGREYDPWRVGQLLCTTRWEPWLDKRLFVTLSEFCPDPLPDGGLII